MNKGPSQIAVYISLEGDPKTAYRRLCEMFRRAKKAYPDLGWVSSDDDWYDQNGEQLSEDTISTIVMEMEDTEAEAKKEAKGRKEDEEEEEEE